jgi:serine/threonine protein kinase
LWDALKERSRGSQPLLGAVRQHGEFLAIQFLDGVNYLYEQGLVHCDLHKNNVLLHEKAGRLSIKIVDFGLCRTLSDGSSHRVVRHKDREQYMDRFFHVAPELVAGQPYSTASDMWTVGYILQKVIGLHRWTNEPIQGKCKMHMSCRALCIIREWGLTSSKNRPSAKNLLDAFRELKRRGLMKYVLS